MNEKKTHAIIIRMHYLKGDQKFEWRFAYFQAMVLPSILRQRNKDFDIAIWCNEWHAERFRRLSGRIKTFGIAPEVEGKIKPGYEKKAKIFFVDFVDWKNVVGLEKYDIQTAIDSDDLLLRRDFIDRIENECRRTRGSLHISFQPYMFHVPMLRTFTCPMKYNPKKGSPFYSIYQPDKNKFFFAYHDSHLQMWKYMDRSITIPEGYCTFSIHGKNETTYLYRGARKIVL
jgi:hypothetical protein